MSGSFDVPSGCARVHVGEAEWWLSDNYHCFPALLAILSQSEKVSSDKLNVRSRSATVATVVFNVTVVLFHGGHNTNFGCVLRTWA